MIVLAFLRIYVLRGLSATDQTSTDVLAVYMIFLRKMIPEGKY